ncbi:Down syndrome cell adhesion molecule homolog [Seriola lalandi dorsalis]|uniref:Down syndrome cell adhesion molecule homolog n=1 Tax=Seriola lalandi dorsalis TaxID=1841481 RepID=UPI000C6F8F24|nr:Down syndrome cell adhesion molecule homolog [Seriola lalandi dorsalis]
MIILGSRRFPLCCSLLFCLHLGCVSADDFRASVGKDVTLTCNYDAQHYGRLPVCWGRAAIPNRGCGNEVIKSDGTSVVSRLSERYLLMGNLGRGDVSLTIRHVQESDSGIYGCRVEIPGWFNDQKHHLKLTVEAESPDSPRVETREVKERTVTVRWAPVFDGGRPITSYTIDLKNKQASWSTAIKTVIANPQLTQVTLVDLSPAKTYNLRMFVRNSVGISEASNVLTITTKEAAPEGPPLDVQLEALTSRSIKVTWKPPRAEHRNGVLQSYSLSYREYDPVNRQFKRWQHQSVTATRELESVILRDLKPSTKYGVLVQAKTIAGAGPPSSSPLCSTLDEVHTTSTVTSIQSTSTAATRQDTTSFTSAHTTSQTVEPDTAATDWAQSTTGFTSVPPDPPVVELKGVIDNTISIFWTPGFEGDSPITGYFLEYKALKASWDYTKTVVDFSPNQTEATIIEINPSTYNMRMFAKNSLGTSKPSNVLTITTGETGHQRDSPSTPTSTDTHSSVVAKEGDSSHLAAILVPVVLVVLVVATFTAWQLRRIKQKQGSLIMWMASGALRYRGSESLQEL